MTLFTNLEFWKLSFSNIIVLYIADYKDCIIFSNQTIDLDRLFMPFEDELEGLLEEDINRLKRRNKEYTLTKISQHECVSLLKKWQPTLTDADIERAFNNM